MTRPLLALLALALVGCSRPEPEPVGYLVADQGMHFARPHTRVTGFYIRSGRDSTAHGEQLLYVRPGIVVFMDTGDTLRGGDAVRYLFPDSMHPEWPGAEIVHDTIWQHAWIGPNAPPSDTLRGRTAR